MRTLKDSGLAVSIYPRLGYDASAGGGVAESSPDASASNRLNIEFDPAAVNIPDVTWRTATFLGLPLPPIFRIRVQPESLKVSEAVPQPDSYIPERFRCACVLS